MNFLSTITKSLRRWLRIYLSAELSPLSIEIARRPRRGHQEVWSEAACPAGSKGISSAKRSHKIASFLFAVIERFGKPIAPSPPQRPVILPGNCDRAVRGAVQDRAERMATATIQILTARAKMTTTELWPQLVEMYRDEIADVERQRAGETRLQDE